MRSLSRLTQGQALSTFGLETPSGNGEEMQGSHVWHLPFQVNVKPRSRRGAKGCWVARGAAFQLSSPGTPSKRASAAALQSQDSGNGLLPWRLEELWVRGPAGTAKLSCRCYGKANSYQRLHTKTLFMQLSGREYISIVLACFPPNARPFPSSVLLAFCYTCPWGLRSHVPTAKGP